MTPFSPIEYAFAAMALVMLALLFADVYWAHDRVRLRQQRRARLELPRMRVAALRANRRRA